MMTVGELKAALTSVPDETQISCNMNDEELIGSVTSVSLEDGVLTIFAEENFDEEDEEDEEEDTGDPPTTEG